MNTPDAPAAPDPNATSNKQYGWNVKAAKGMQQLNKQALFNPLLRTERHKSLQIAKGIDTAPIDLSNDATEARLMELGQKRLDPIIAQRGTALETSLRNQGVMPGTEAYARAMTANGQQTNDAYNQLLLGGHGQAVNEAQIMHNQPYQDLSALNSMGGGIKDPTPSVSLTPPDYAGIAQNNYLGQLQQQQLEIQRQNALYGAIGSIGGQIGSAALGGWGGA